MNHIIVSSYIKKIFTARYIRLILRLKFAKQETGTKFPSQLKELLFRSNSVGNTAADHNHGGRGWIPSVQRKFIAISNRDRNIYITIKRISFGSLPRSYL